ncbi:MAG: phosphomannomutase/phosphoglucomutase [Candidatus Liptonbacteria bacterium]|nr:phosphomannomutase/phosphoglucomutase [Candidatus Liptonbacteria bacterium]
MKVNPHIFRGYDLRGLVEKDLTPEIVEHIGKALGTYLKRRGIRELVVGRDSRATGPAYSEALIRGLTWTGADVIDIGMTLVGTFYWAQHFLGRRGGAFVSASHNPPEYNGFKFANDFSETLVSDGMQELRRIVEEEDYEQGEAPGKFCLQDVREEYYADILSRVKLEGARRVVVDPTASTAGALVPELLRRAGCEVIEKNCEVDSSFPLGVADPTATDIAERLRDEVLEANADIGFSYDADGDRIGIVDEKGGIIWNDVLVALFAQDVLQEHPGATIMYNTLCSRVVEETIRNAGGTPFMWRTGHSFLKKKNQEVGAAFIGELSGHFFFSKDFYNHDDGMYSTMRLLRYLTRTNQTLSEAVAKLPQYVSSPEIKVFCADDKKAELVKKASPQLRKDFPQAQVIDDERAGDGIRMDLPDAMLVVRYSQNGPYLTIKFEGKTEVQYNELKGYLSQFLRSFGEIDWKSKINVNVEALGVV